MDCSTHKPFYAVIFLLKYICNVQQDLAENLTGVYNLIPPKNNQASAERTTDVLYIQTGRKWIPGSKVCSYSPPKNWMPPATLPTALEINSVTQHPMSAVRATRRRRPQPKPVTTVQILHSTLGMAWKEA